MRVTSLLLASIFAIGCSGEIAGPKTPPIPATPAPPPPTPAAPQPPAAPVTPTAADKVSLWGMIVSAGGACIEGASITVVSGQSAGTTIVQDAECDAWSYGGGFVFENLTPEVPMTVVVHAPGFSQKEVTIVPQRVQYAAWVISAANW